MNYQALLNCIRAQKCAGIRFEQSGRHSFRDRVTVYHDGKIFFERFCYGEAAGLVFTMWASGADEQGNIAWDYDACPNSHKTEAPKRLTGATETALLFDEKPCEWTRDALLKTDTANGYGFWQMLFKKRG